jgi:phytoene dehydrogenase-like protein
MPPRSRGNVTLSLAKKGVRVAVLEAKETIGVAHARNELTLAGLLHDDCSAVLPMTVASPFTDRSS